MSTSDLGPSPAGTELVENFRVDPWPNTVEAVDTTHIVKGISGNFIKMQRRYAYANQSVYQVFPLLLMKRLIGEFPKVTEIAPENYSFLV